MKWKTSMEIHVLHHNWLLLVASETGIPFQVQDRWSSPTPVKPTPRGSDSKTTSQEDDGLVITQHQARKTSLGWINRKLWLILWMSAGASTEDGWRFQVMCSGHGHLHWQNGQQDHVCLVEEWMSTCRYHQIADWTTTTTAHRTGTWYQDHRGMKLVYTPLCQAHQWWIIIYFDVEYCYSTIKGPQPPMLGWLNSLTSPIQNLTCMKLSQTN